MTNEMTKGLRDREYQKFISVGDTKTAVRVSDAAISSLQAAAATETVTTAAGAAGTTGTTKVNFAPVFNSTGTDVGDTSSTSFSWVTGTMLTTEVAFDPVVDDTTQLAALANGEYAINYDTGKILYKKATAATSDTCNYTIRKQVVDTELTADVNLVVDNISMFQTNIADSTTMGPALIDANGHLQTDVLTLPGSLTGYAEDAQHTSGDIGLMSLAVRNDALAALATTDGDYTPLQVNAKGAVYADISSVNGSDLAVTNPIFAQVSATAAANLTGNRIWVTSNMDMVAGTATSVTSGNLDNGTQRVAIATNDVNMSAIKTAVEIIDNPVAVLGTATYAEATTSGMITGAVRNDTLAALADTDNEIAPLQVDSLGALYVQSRGYDSGTDSGKVFEVSPVSDHHNEETATLTTVLNATPQYIYMDMDGYRYGSIQIAAVDAGGGDTHVITLEGTNQDDGTAQASCTYQDVTLALTGVANVAATSFWIFDTPIAFKFLRVKDTTAGGNNDGGITCYIKKMY